MTPDGFTHHTTRTSAGRIHYVRGGSGPLLLLLHGWPQTWFEWRRVMPELAEHYTVVAADWRGAGFSGRPAAVTTPTPSPPSSGRSCAHSPRTRRSR